MIKLLRKFALFLAAGMILVSGQVLAQSSVAAGSPGSAENPLRVMLVPTDGGTEDGTRADFAPIFNAVSRTSGLKFTIRVGQSYASVVEGMVNDLVDIAFVGPTLYLQAAAKGAAEPLAVAVLKGESVYYAGFFAKKGFEMPDLSVMKGKSMAFGDVNSSSSFTIQVGMLLKAGIDPARDLSKVFLTGGHANSLNALTQGHVNVAAASFNSYQKAVNQGAVNADEIVPVLASVPIPYPPFIMLPTLSDDVKARLRNGFDTVHEDPNITPEMIRGFGGILVDRYTSDITHETFLAVQEMLDLVTPEVKSEMLKRASEN